MNRAPQYARPDRSLASLRRHPLAARLGAMLVGFAVLVPVAAVASGGGAVVEAGAMPGATLEGVVLRSPAIEHAAPTTLALTARTTAAKPVAPAKAVPAKKNAPAKVTTPRTTVAKPTTAKAKAAAAKAAQLKALAAQQAAAKAKAAAAAKQQADAKKAAEVAAFLKALAAQQAAKKAAAAPAAPPAPARTSWTAAQVEQVIRDVWPDDLEDHAIAIARRESKLVPTSHNWCCYGIFAIYLNAGRRLLASMGITTVEQLYDPVTNARAAYAIYQAAGWAPWKL